MKTKATIMAEKLKEIAELQAKMEGDEAERTDENQATFDALADEVKSLKGEIEREQMIESAKNLLNEPARESKAAGVGTYQPGVVTPRAPETPGFGLVNSEAFREAAKAWEESGKRRFNLSFELKNAVMPGAVKATFDTAATGQETYINYQGNGGMPVLIERQRLTIRNLLAQGTTVMNSVPYIRETSFSNAATTVAESGLKPEATFALEDVFAPVKKIAVTSKVSDEMWADFPGLRSYVDNRLRLMNGITEEDQLLNGNGSGSNLTGILQTSGIQTEALGVNTRADAIYRAMTKIRSVGFFEPDGIVIHPNDWQDIRLAKDGANQYFGGGPFTGAYGNGGGIAPDMLWNLPVVVTTAISEGTALVGAFRFGAQIFDRQGVTVDMSNQNEDDFVTNRMTIRVEQRLALAVYRPLAFCTVTGI
jgi:HK97 family phage major capsid protein